jgi:hypothetical protein
MRLSHKTITVPYNSSSSKQRIRKATHLLLQEAVEIFMQKYSSTIKELWSGDAITCETKIKVKVRVKLRAFLCVTNYHAMKTHPLL